MIEAYIHIVIGVALFISANAFRLHRKIGISDGLFWLLFVLEGISLQTTFIPLFIYPILMPAIIRIQLLSWSGKKINADQLTGSAVSLVIAGLIIRFTTFDNLIVGVLSTMEITFTLRLIRLLFRRKGIASIGNEGANVLWVRSFVGANILLLISIYLYFIGLSPIFLYITIALYGSVGLLGIIRYSPSSDAFKPLTSETKYAKSTLDPAEKYRILRAIEDQLGQHGFHLNPDASLKELASAIKSTTHAVSQVINEEKGWSFFELLAYHRVQDAKKLFRKAEYQHYKIEQIAEEVGYLSKSAFNTSFKKITGLTPSEFRERGVRDDKVERSTYKEISENMGYRDTFGYLKISNAMLSNFFKLYFRNLKKNRVFTLLNLTGLVTGFTSCVLIFLYLSNEMSYDKFHDRSEDIYRIYLQATNPQTRTPHPMAEALVRDFPEVESAVSLTPLYGPGLTLQSIYVRNPLNNRMFLEPDVFAADSTFFDVFDFKLLSGDPKTALKEVGSVVITESVAKKYFGNEDPIGKELEDVANDSRGVVTAVMQDVPRASHFHPRIIIAYTSLKSGNPDNTWFSWNDPGHFNYVRLRPGADPRKLESAIPEWINRVSSGVNPQMLEYLTNGIISYNLQSIESIHLYSHLKWELEANSSSMYIYILMGAILFIIIILSINYINLSTARTYERGREVGIRKVLGVTKIALSTQFVLESILTCAIALLLAFSISWLLIDQFNALTGKQFITNDLLNSQLVVSAIAMMLSIGLVSGIAPAVTLNKVKPVEVLKGKILNQKSGNWKRLTLVGVQFAVSTVMIFGSIIILKQVNFIENKSMGFDEEALVVLKLQRNDLRPSAETIKAELLKDPSILSVGGISNLPGGQFNQNDLFLEEDPAIRVPASELWVDFEGLETLGINLKDGRFFESSYQQDSSGRNYIINEIAANGLGLENPIGSKVMWNSEVGALEGTIVGIVEDFNYKSLHEPVRPLLIMVGLSSFNNLILRINTSDVPRTIEHITNVYEQFDPVFVADVTFMDDRLNQLYTAERNAFSIFNLFSYIALVLAAMGLLGLAYLIITQRTKEIGIRKVLGAHVFQILWMENRSFLKVIAVSVIIGLPMSMLIMNQWLSEFAYRTTFGMMPFVTTILILILVAVGSVTFAVLRTVLKNPSEALRYE